MKMVKGAVMAGVLVAALAAAGSAGAGSDDIRVYLYKPLFADPAFLARLPKGVKYYFGDQPANVKTQLGPVKSSRRRPTPARKTPISESCQRLADTALVRMGKDALRQGGNAVIGITSIAGDTVMASDDRYQCAVGMQISAVSLSGTAAIVE